MRAGFSSARIATPPTCSCQAIRSVWARALQASEIMVYGLDREGFQASSSDSRAVAPVSDGEAESPATSRTWGPQGYRIGRHVRYRRTAVESWLEKQAGVRIAG